MAIQLIKQEIISVAGNPPVKVFGSNSRRVYVSFFTVPTAGFCLVSPQVTRDFTGTFADLFQTISEQFLRKDLGDLITGELYLSDGGGGSPNGTISVIEGILL